MNKPENLRPGSVDVDYPWELITERDIDFADVSDQEWEGYADSVKEHLRILRVFLQNGFTVETLWLYAQKQRKKNKNTARITSKIQTQKPINSPNIQLTKAQVRDLDGRLSATMDFLNQCKIEAAAPENSQAKQYAVEALFKIASRSTLHLGELAKVPNPPLEQMARTAKLFPILYSPFPEVNSQYNDHLSRLTMASEYVLHPRLGKTFTLVEEVGRTTLVESQKIKISIHKLARGQLLSEAESIALKSTRGIWTVNVNKSLPIDKLTSYTQAKIEAIRTHSEKTFADYMKKLPPIDQATISEWEPIFQAVFTAQYGQWSKRLKNTFPKTYRKPPWKSVLETIEKSVKTALLTFPSPDIIA